LGLSGAVAVEVQVVGAALSREASWDWDTDHIDSAASEGTGAVEAVPAGTWLTG